MASKVIYLSHSMHGFACAWACWAHLGQSFPWKEVEYLPANYGDDAPEAQAGDRLYVLDEIYPAHVLKDLIDVVQVDVKKPGNSPVEIWEWEHWASCSDKPVPPILRFIQSQYSPAAETELSDETNNIAAALSAFRQDFAVWDMLAKLSHEQLAAIANQIGNSMRLAKAHEILTVIENYTRFQIAGYEMRCLQISKPRIIISDLSRVSFEDGISSIVWHENGMDYWRLVSDKVDVGAIARSFGGCGNNNSAGFQVSFTKIKGFLVPTISIFDEWADLQTVAGRLANLYPNCPCGLVFFDGNDPSFMAESFFEKLTVSEIIKGVWDS